jgi:hypothetical protein
MIELIEFLERLTKKMPNFESKNLIRLEMGNKISSMIVVSVSGNSLIYRFANEPYHHPWNPRSGTLFRWVVLGMEEYRPNKNAPKILGNPCAISLKIDKVFGEFKNKEWPYVGSN